MPLVLEAITRHGATTAMTEPVRSRDLPRTPGRLTAAGVLTEEFPLALKVCREGPPTSELPSLLRRRLLFIAILLAVGTVILVLLTFLWPGPWYANIGFCAMFLEVAALAGVLGRKAHLSSGQLRLIEALLFATLFAFWSLIHAGVYPSFRLEQPPLWFGSVMAHAISLPWVIIILVYGIFIPNSWQRCAAVVGIAAAIPLVISATTGLSADATRGHGPMLFWVPMAVWLASAGALAIYGAHRIEVLRAEASDARQLGQYELKHRLGLGGMGEVYLAQHILLRRPCAVKFIRPERAGDPRILRRFEREVQATAGLTHPNTVQIFDYGHSEDGTFYYAMEYLPGLNLEQLVQGHGPLLPERVVHFLRQVCGALREAHAVGLIHRDIKPSNIIACERGGWHDVAKLLDFGLVQSFGSAAAINVTQEGMIAGTPAYMSPEQADGRKDLNGGCDIYSVGAVAYYLLTGQPPFVRPTPLRTLLAHLNEQPIPPHHLQARVPADLEAVVMRCLEKDPTQRYADVRSLDQALGGCHSAGLWSQDQALAWWQAQAGRSAT